MRCFNAEDDLFNFGPTRLPLSGVNNIAEQPKPIPDLRTRFSRSANIKQTNRFALRTNVVSGCQNLLKWNRYNPPSLANPDFDIQGPGRSVRIASVCHAGQNSGDVTDAR